ncbi:hypothetical protein, partial [Embleya sp. NPDC005575]|uniref:hypothetical protein n=1 Tax=Embleya sp. NPDC005575 TaxID=3156892 RepID=UPI0033BD654A
EVASPTPTATRWASVNVLARCVLPALMDLTGRHVDARELRARPLESRRLSRETAVLVNTWDAHHGCFNGSHAALSPGTDLVAEAAGGDLLADLAWLTPAGVGALTFARSLAEDAVRAAMQHEDGPERVGHAVARCQSDAIMVLREVIG